MPANRSRTLQWRRCLQQIHERNGALELAVARQYGEGQEGSHLVWRVRVLELSSDEIVVEQPMALGQPIHLEDAIPLVAILAVGQNRWMFHTKVVGAGAPRTPGGGNGRSVPSIRLEMPTTVRRCQRRNHYRIQTGAIQLPRVDFWPLLDPKSVVLAERANELQFERDEAAATGIADPVEPGPNLMPDIGPEGSGLLVNLGGGGVGLYVAPEHAQLLARYRIFWLRIELKPELVTPICATAKLVHTHMQSDQHIYAGLAFDFSFNAGHQRFVVEQICRFIALQQREQFEREDEDVRRTA